MTMLGRYALPPFMRRIECCRFRRRSISPFITKFLSYTSYNQPIHASAPQFPLNNYHTLLTLRS
jgi:hypothetical protein